MVLPSHLHNITKPPPLTIVSGLHTSSFGPCFIAIADNDALCRFEFIKNSSLAAAQTRLIRNWPKATITFDSAATTPHFDLAWHSWQYKKTPPITLQTSGTPLQYRVWQALTAIPYGATTTYSAIAKQVDHPQAVRAVASAIGANPISLLIPCHRVLRKDGSLGGFAWGVDIKQAILNTENAPYAA